MKRRIYILGILILFLLLAVGSCRKAGSWLVKEDNPVHADVMVMLMGSFADRILQVADLYEQGVAGKVSIPVMSYISIPSPGFVAVDIQIVYNVFLYNLIVY